MTARRFRLRYSGDFLDEHGQVAQGYLGVEPLIEAGFIDYDFLTDQAPTPGDDSYWDRLYSLEIEARHIAKADGIVVIRPYVPASAFADGAENLVVIGRAGVGTDKIDLDACTRNGVAVFNAPGTLALPMASATMLMMLALAKKLPAQEAMARSGCWRGQAAITGDDLDGKVLGIIGLGKIATELIRLLEPFGMKVMVHSRHASTAAAEALGISLAGDIDTLLRESDYVLPLCDLSERTRGMLGERELGLMKPTAYFVNTGRGELVDQQALVRALAEKRIAGAALDVFEHEPLPADDPLTRMDNVILTPHWLGSSRRSLEEVMDTVTRGILRAAQGEVPENIVNKAVLDEPFFRSKLARFEGNRQAASG